MFIRRLPKFEYHSPASIAGALGLLKKYGDKARIIAGGHRSSARYEEEGAHA